MNTSPPLIETPLQAALRGPDGGLRLQSHRTRLAPLECCLARGVAAGLPPADYALAHRLLTMLQAGQRMLATLPVSEPNSTPARAGAGDPVPAPASHGWPHGHHWRRSAPTGLTFDFINNSVAKVAQSKETELRNLIGSLGENPSTADPPSPWHCSSRCSSGR